MNIKLCENGIQQHHYYVVVTDLFGLCSRSLGQKCWNFDFCIILKVLLPHFIVSMDITYQKIWLFNSSKVQRSSGLFYSLWVTAQSWMEWVIAEHRSCILLFIPFMLELQWVSGQCGTKSTNLHAVGNPHTAFSVFPQYSRRISSKAPANIKF